MMLLEGNLRGVQHLGIPVCDIEKSKIFYSKFGFQKTMETEIKVEEGIIKIAFLQKEDFKIELYQLTDKDLEEVRSRKNGHIDHIALDVEDVEQAYQELKAAGFEVLEEAPVFLPLWENGVKYFNILGPDGEKIEFNQRLSNKNF